MRGTLWTVVVIALALALLVPLVGGGLSDAETEDRSEQLTVNYTVDSELQDADAYRNLTITNNGQTLANGTDYIFTESSGTVDWQNTSATAEGDIANATYTAVDPTVETEDTTRVLETASSWIGFLLVIAALGYVIKLMAGGDF